MTWKSSFLPLIPLLLVASVSGAATLTVDDDGPSDFSLVQDALDAAMDGDEIVVMPGVYIENLDTLGKAITLRSSDPLDDAVVASTVLDGNQSGSVIRCDSGEGAGTVIRGLTIRNGSGSEFDGGGPVKVGGGILCCSSYPLIEHCVIRDNVAETGGGLCVATTCLENTADEFNIRNTVFLNNVARIDVPAEAPLSSNGGGLWYEGSATCIIAGCTFIGNEADSGGAISNQSVRRFELTESLFEKNTAFFQGGAIDLSVSAFEASPISRTTFSKNYALARGGAIHLRSFDIPAFEHCLFSDNSTDGNGGAISSRSSLATFERCDFYRNTAANNGGALHHADEADHEYSLCEFRWNEAGNDGGAIFNNLSTPLFNGCVIAENHAARNGGGTAGELSLMHLELCTIAGNTAGVRGGGMDLQISRPTLTFTVVWANTPTDIETLFLLPIADLSILPLDIPGGLFNVNADPQFLDPSAGNYRLRATSPGIDTGFGGGGGVDIDGNNRFVGDGLDIGAYELQCLGDCDGSGRTDFDDLVSMLFEFGESFGACDSDQSGTVDFNDLIAALFLFGPCP